MEKTILINGEEINLKASGFTPILYKTNFKKDLFKELVKAVGGYNSIISLEKNDMSEEESAMLLLENLDMSFFYELLWTNAKSADKYIADMETWLSSFDSLPIIELIEDLISLNFSNLESKKK